MFNTNEAAFLAGYLAAGMTETSDVGTRAMTMSCPKCFKRVQIQDVIIKAPMVQLEHLLELVNQHFEVPGLGSVIKKAHAMARQTYSGDITIHPERHLANLGRTFSNFGQREIDKILWEGRRATWPTRSSAASRS